MSDDCGNRGKADPEPRTAGWGATTRRAPFTGPQAELTGAIVGAFYRAYNRLDYGFLEHVYLEAMVIELEKLGLRVRAEAPIDVWYDGKRIAVYRADLLVEESIVVELKSSHSLDAAAKRQLLNYLRCTDIEVGLLLHFGPKPSVKRLVHTRNIGRPA
jgi:GxxExxY protein